MFSFFVNVGGESCMICLGLGLLPLPCYSLGLKFALEREFVLENYKIYIVSDRKGRKDRKTTYIQ